MSTLPDESQKRAHSAKDFEALLITQMLHSARAEGSGWLGAGGDSDDAGDAAVGLGEQQLAQAISNGGGLGLARVIDRALSRDHTAGRPTTR